MTPELLSQKRDSDGVKSVVKVEKEEKKTESVVEEKKEVEAVNADTLPLNCVEITRDVFQDSFGSAMCEDTYEYQD
ncbi:hypothetical protein GW750_03760 [bacterium]|nr:hypothetical protein [bacterium]